MTHVLVIAALSGAVSVYSASDLSTTAPAAARITADAVHAIKVENISLDYSDAHAALMRRPEDSTTNTF